MDPPLRQAIGDWLSLLAVCLCKKRNCRRFWTSGFAKGKSVLAPERPGRHIAAFLRCSQA